MGEAHNGLFSRKKKSNMHSFCEKKILKHLKFFDKGDFQTATDLYSEKKKRNSIIPNERIQLTTNQRQNETNFLCAKLHQMAPSRLIFPFYFHC